MCFPNYKDAELNELVKKGYKNHLVLQEKIITELKSEGENTSSPSHINKYNYFISKILSSGRIEEPKSEDQKDYLRLYLITESVSIEPNGIVHILQQKREEEGKKNCSD